jgi:hypothetical protein
MGFASVDTAMVYKQIKAVLKQQNLSDNDIKFIENPVKKLIKEEIDKERIIKIVVDFKQSGMQEKDLAFCLNKINELMSAGENFVKSGEIVKLSLNQAKSKGAKDKKLMSQMSIFLKVKKEEIIKNSNLRRKQIDQALKNAEIMVKKQKEDKKSVKK